MVQPAGRAGIIVSKEFNVFLDIYSDDPKGASLTGEVTWKQLPLYAPTSPAMAISRAAAVQLMNDLWKLGIRPTLEA